jgi:hypothetical protein
MQIKIEFIENGIEKFSINNVPLIVTTCYIPKVFHLMLLMECEKKNEYSLWSGGDMDMEEKKEE